MRFRFLVKDYDGFSHSVEDEFIDVDAAKDRAFEMVRDEKFVESVTLYSLLSDGSWYPVWNFEDLGYEDL
jgi:hypothetical protein